MVRARVCSLFVIFVKVMVILLGLGKEDNAQGIAESLRNQACAILAMVRYPFGGEEIML